MLIMTAKKLWKCARQNSINSKVNLDEPISSTADRERYVSFPTAFDLTFKCFAKSSNYILVKIEEIDVHFAFFQLVKLQSR